MTMPPKFTHSACSKCGSPRSVINSAWLRFVRRRGDVTLREMARLVGHSAAYLCDIEMGRRNCLPAMRAAYEALASEKGDSR